MRRETNERVAMALRATHRRFVNERNVVRVNMRGGIDALKGFGANEVALPMDWS